VIVDADHLAHHLDGVPVLIVVCPVLADLVIADLNLDRPSVAGGASIYPSVQNLLLAARHEGLGATLTTILCEFEPAVRPARHPGRCDHGGDGGIGLSRPAAADTAQGSAGVRDRLLRAVRGTALTPLMPFTLKRTANSTGDWCRVKPSRGGALFGHAGPSGYGRPTRHSIELRGFEARSPTW
jgi:hypothetical protein